MTFPLQLRKATLVYPIGKPPRTAVLGAWFRAKDPVRVFPQGWTAEAAAYAPQAIAATRRQLIELAPYAPPVTHALIVIARQGDPWLTPADRDFLWRAYQVPIFEQLISENGDLLAAECEAHDGLHLATTELSGYALDPTPCACGSASPRLIPKKPSERARAAAVSEARAR